MLLQFIQSRSERRLFRAAERSLSKNRHGSRPFLLVRAFRLYEQRFVVRDYYRPSGYIWKQGLDADFRQAKAGEIRTFSLAGRDIHYTVAYYGLLYRLAFLQPAEMEAVEKLRLSEVWQLENTSAAEREKRLATAFDVMLLQHVVQASEGLAENAEFLLQADWADERLKSLAADMAVQARYEQVRLKIFQNTITSADILPVKQAAAYAEEALGLQNRALCHYEALIAAMEGNLTEAVRLHSMAPPDGYRTQFFRTAAQVQPLDTFTDADFAKTCWPTQPVWDTRASQHKSCSLIACDEAYFYQFFEKFAESFALQNPGGLLHFHGVGFEPEIATIAALARRLEIEVNVSHDTMDLKVLLPDRFKGFCAGARYLFLPAFLEHYQSIIIHDVDGVLTTDMTAIWEHSDAEIMISTLALNKDRRGCFALWSNIGAGAFAIRRSEGSVAFANALSRYLAERFAASENDSERYFFSDQTGLLLATLAYKNTVSMARMPEIFSQTDETRGPGRGKAKKAAQVAWLKRLRAANQKI